MANQAITQASNYFDLQGLDQLRQKAQGNSKEAIREVANQFEAMFATMLIKSMRQANEAFETESPFNNKQTKFYTDMQDKQLALDISRHGSLGLADALVRQLDPSSIGAPKSVPMDKLMMPNSHSQEMLKLEKSQPVTEFNKADKTIASTGSKKREQDPQFTDQKSFIETLMPYAKKVAKVLGIAPEVLVAQSALETGWGKKIINSVNNQSSFNLFNIKASKNWAGDSVVKESLEVEQGVAVKRASNFRSYNSLQESFLDYQDFILNNKRYSDALKQGTNASGYIKELQQAGYATDPNYAQKINSIMQSEEFTTVLAEGVFNG